MHEETKAVPMRPTMKLLVLIVDRDRAKAAMDALQKMHARFSLVCAGYGTATSEIMDILGLDGNEKAVMLYLEPDFLMDTLLSELTERMELRKPGKGIAFILPISGMGHQAVHMLHPDVVHRWHDCAHEETHHAHQICHCEEPAGTDIGRDVEKMKAEAKHELIVAVVRKGFSEEVVAAARTAGATGGTVIPAHQIGLEGATKFFGISVQDEKDIVAIIADGKDKREIMSSIGKACGMASEARGIVFSLPVDGIAGLS